MKKASETLESEPTIADMVLSFVTMHLNNEDRFSTATKGLCENLLKAAPGAFSHPKSNNLKFVCTAALGKDEGWKLYRCITSARSSNKKAIDTAWKLRMKDMPYDMVKWISDLHDKVELFEEDLKLLKEEVAALALRVDDHEGRLAALENRIKDREDGRPACLPFRSSSMGSHISFAACSTFFHSAIPPSNCPTTGAGRSAVSGVLAKERPRLRRCFADRCEEEPGLCMLVRLFFRDAQFLVSRSKVLLCEWDL